MGTSSVAGDRIRSLGTRLTDHEGATPGPYARGDPAPSRVIPYAANASIQSTLRVFGPATGGGLAASVVVLPAMGVHAAAYDAFAFELSRCGAEVFVPDLRGQGASSVRPSRDVDYGMADLLAEDVAGAVREAQRAASRRPMLLCGHSLGGYLALLYACNRPGDIRGVVLVACASSYYRAYAGTSRLGLRVAGVALPALARLWGYHAGQRLGFGGREARTLISDWARHVRTGLFLLEGTGTDFDSLLGGMRMPVLSIRFSTDSFAPEAGVEYLLSRIPRAEVKRSVFTPEDLEGSRVNHFSWVGHARAVADHIRSWANGRDLVERRSAR